MDTKVIENKMPMSKSQTIAVQGIAVHNRYSAFAYVGDA